MAKNTPVAFLLPMTLLSLSEGLKHTDKWGGTTNEMRICVQAFAFSVHSDQMPKNIMLI